MNLLFKGMVFKWILAKMRATRVRGFTGGAFTWKTKDCDYYGVQKPMFEEVLAEWLLVPVEERQKYNCANFLSSPFPTKSTSKAFFSENRKQYFKYRSAPKSNSVGTFWKDFGPTFDSILELVRAHSIEGNGDGAREEVTDLAQQLQEERLEVRKAKQAAAGLMTEAVGSLREQADKIGERNEADSEAQARQLEVAESMRDLLRSQGVESAKREEDRDAKTQQYRQEHAVIQAARHAKLDAQHDDYMSCFTPAYKVDTTKDLPWGDYTEFWQALPDITVEQQKLVSDEVPTIQELVELAKEKDLCNTLKDAGLPILRAKRIALLIQESVYTT